jgi:protein gp37
MARTKIEWTDHTCDAFWGCLQGCEYCAARAMAWRFGEKEAKRRGHIPSIGRMMKNFEPLYLAEAFDKIPKKPCKVFISFMGDWAAEWNRDFEMAREDMFVHIHRRPDHIFQLLTKQPQNLIKYSPYPANCWVGVSCTGDQQMFNKAMFGLSQVNAKVKFISFEPLLEHQVMYSDWLTLFGKPLIQWLIIGQQTPVKAATMPKVSWIKEIVEAADSASIPVFLKDNLRSILPLPKKLFCTVHPTGVRYLRQEFPR